MGPNELTAPLTDAHKASNLILKGDMVVLLPCHPTTSPSSLQTPSHLPP
ncbi:hypothetical protein U1Q18_052522 [Sarracenia purpurea var. burkii]